MKLPAVLKTWGSPAFEQALKHELAQLDADALHLQQALSQSSYTSGADRTVLVLGTADEGKSIRAKVGIFYSGIIPGCSCADDPTPMSELTEYCEVQIDIDKTTAETTVTLLKE